MTTENKPAFPTMRADFGGETDGMTLRDYFAAKAMQSIVSALHQGLRPAGIKDMCFDSYAIADEMLKAREQ